MIKDHTFYPDASRSGYFTSLEHEPEPFVRPPVQNKLGDRVEIESDDQDDARSNSTEASQSNEESENEQLAKSIEAKTDEAKIRRARHAGDFLFIHKRWKTIHLSHTETDDKLACGRVITPVFTRLYEYPTFDYSRCSICFGQNP